MRQQHGLRTAWLVPVVLLCGQPGAALASNGGSAWTSLGPDGGYIQALAMAPSAPQVMYASTPRNGVFRSEDAGVTWTPASAGLPFDEYYGCVVTVDGLAVASGDPHTVYASMAFGGVYRSEDGGVGWAASGLTAQYVLAMAVAPDAPQTVYALTNDGVYVSQEGGRGWAATGPGSPAGVALALAPGLPTTLYVGSAAGVHRSDDGGAGWTLVNAGLTDHDVAALAVDPSAPAVVYAGTNGGGVYKTDDAGAAWSAANTGLSGSFVLSLLAAPTAPTTAYAVTNRGLFASVNGGADWTGLDPVLRDDLGSLPWPGLRAALAVDPRPPTTVFAGTGLGVVKSADGGVTWTATSRGLTGAGATALAIGSSAPTALYASVFGSGVFRSLDGGAHWTGSRSGLTDLGVRVLAVDPSAPGTVCAGTDGGLFTSADGGATWAAADGSLQGRSVMALARDPRTPGTLFAGTNGAGLHKSTDGGATWAPIGSAFPRLRFIRALAVDPNVPLAVYAGNDDGLYKSDDGGITWTPAMSGLENTCVQALAAAPSMPTTVYAGTYGGVFKSVDGGVTWTTCTGTPCDGDVCPVAVAKAAEAPHSLVRALAVDPEAPAVVLAGGNGRGVYRSEDAGASWALVNAGLTDRGIAALAVAPGDPRTLYAGTLGGGVFAIAWRRDTAVQSCTPAPAPFGALAQNRPNPFNGRTAIGFTLRTASVASLELYDVQGQKVATLVDRQLRGAGSHNVEFDGSGLASGVYLYRLRAASLDRVRPMTLLK